MNSDRIVGALALKRSRWGWGETAFWLVAAASILLFSDRYLILTEMAWLGLFALSLDLILGYAGIVSLGHAAFFGVGAYAAGLLAVHGIVREPALALVAAGLAAMALGFVTSFLVIRGAELSQLMVTLGIALLLRELANRFSDITGGFDGLQGIVIDPVLGLFAFDLYGRTGFIYCLVVLFVLFLAARMIVHSPFGLSLRAIRNILSAAAGRRKATIELVDAFSDDSAARDAGLLPGDRLVSVQGRPVSRFADVRLALLDTVPGDEAALEVERDRPQSPPMRMAVRFFLR